ncbi:MAG: hypothetical protein J1E65_08655 [Lachnospiraceae bacterium]|nr:hypothetical protein [Lachnospiraceae bacterium]
MEKNDTICLLKECDAGTKMAVSSIDEVLDRIQTPDMKQMLTKIKKDHEKLGNEIHSLLIEHNSEEKEPNPMAKGMSWMKTNMKLGMDESDATVADLLTDGCNMGIKSLYRYMNQYQAADSTSKSICKSLAGIEEELCRDLRKYL